MANHLFYFQGRFGLPYLCLFVAGLFSFLATACSKTHIAGEASYSSTATPATDPPGTPTDWLSISNAEWKRRLQPGQFYVTREKGTEPPFSGKYWDTKQAGTYHCVCCDAPLFESTTKFQSGTGWPSFSAPRTPGTLDEHNDESLFSPRIEITCHRCGAHLGHVFGDGPAPTGKRYCINSAALALRDGLPGGE